MKDHPLTPMWDCRIAELMRPQSKYPCQVLCRRDFSKFSDIQAQETERPYYLIPDYETDEDWAQAIVRHFGHLSFPFRWKWSFKTTGRISAFQLGS